MGVEHEVRASKVAKIREDFHLVERGDVELGRDLGSRDACFNLGNFLNMVGDYRAGFLKTIAGGLPPDGLHESPAVQITAVSAGANTTFTITFRRDPRATDVTYRLQTSPDLTTWTTVVQSVGGGAPTGSAFLSDVEIVAEAPVRTVTARETVPGPNAKRFARLQINR